MFQDNPLSGACFLAALFWGAIVADAPHVAIGGLNALVAATVMAQCQRADPALLASGHYGYNGILTGLALSYFLGPGILVLAYAALGGAITALAMLGPMNAAKPWNVPAHTYPFVLVTWLFLLATQGFSGLSGPTPPSGIVATALDPALSDPLKIVDFFQGVFHSIFASVLQGRRRGRRASSCRTGREFARGGCVRRWGRGPGGHHGASNRCGERTDHQRPAGVQPGLDGNCVRLGVLSTEYWRSRLRGAGHGNHGHCAICAERCTDATGPSPSLRTLRCGGMDIVSDTKVN
jgi:Urea transporter